MFGTSLSCGNHVSKKSASRDLSKTASFSSLGHCIFQPIKALNSLFNLRNGTHNATINPSVYYKQTNVAEFQKKKVQHLP